MFRDPGGCMDLPMQISTPQRGFWDFFAISQGFSTRKGSKGCPRTYVDAEFHGEFISDGFRTIPDRLGTQKLKKTWKNLEKSPKSRFLTDTSNPDSPSTRGETVVLLSWACNFSKFTSASFQNGWFSKDIQCFFPLTLDLKWFTISCSLLKFRSRGATKYMTL